MSDELRCEQVHELAPELALGIAGGHEREAALRHIAGCGECREFVAELSSVTDEMLSLAPAHEPPFGFETRTLARLAEPAPRRRRRRTVALAAAAALVLSASLGAGVVFRAGSTDRRLADSYRQVLAEGRGSFFTVAPLRGDRGRAGTVWGYEGDPSWLFATVPGAPANLDSLRAEVLTRSGRYVELGAATTDSGEGTWGRAIPVDLRDVRTLRFLDPGGRPIFTASLSPQSPWTGG